MQSACALFYCHLWPVLPYFHTLSHRRQDFRWGGGGGVGWGEGIEHKMCVLVFSATFV